MSGTDVLILVSIFVLVMLLVVLAVAETGLNRITWDLSLEKEQRYDALEAGEAGQFVFVPAGTYDLELTVGKAKSSAKLVVSYPPGVGPE